MPEPRPLPIRLISANPMGGRTASSQALECSGLKSFLWMSSTLGPGPQIAATPVTPESGKTADFAGQILAAAQPSPHPPRTSVDLLPRLPFTDAVELASLAGTGKMTWPEINAALDAKIKLATHEALQRQRELCDRAPPRLESDKAWVAHNAWNEAKRNGESEIWARYNAKCDDLFANDCGPSDTSPRSLERLFGRERILDRFRSARDAELADLIKRLGPQPPRPTASAMPLSPAQVAMLRSQLTTSESAAIGKLNAVGFVASADMRAAIGMLAGEVAASVANGT